MKKEKINITNQRLVCRDDVEKINGLKLEIFIQAVC